MFSLALLSMFRRLRLLAADGGSLERLGRRRKNTIKIVYKSPLLTSFLFKLAFFAVFFSQFLVPTTHVVHVARKGGGSTQNRFPFVASNNWNFCVSHWAVFPLIVNSFSSISSFVQRLRNSFANHHRLSPHIKLKSRHVVGAECVHQRKSVKNV